MSIAERIKERRRVKGINQEDLGRLIGVSIKTIQRWESGERSPKAEIIPKLADVLGTSTLYLMEQTDDPNSYMLDQILNNTAKYISDHAGELPPSNPAAPEITQEEAMSILRGDKSKAEQPESNAWPVKMVKIPMIGGVIRACCGKGNAYASDVEWEVDGFSYIPASELDAYAWQVGDGGFHTIRVEGNSMEPRIHDGDTLLFGDLPVSNGNFAVVRYDDRLIVRGVYNDRKGHYTLRPLNSAYEDIDVDMEDESKDFYILGKVIRRITVENLADGMM